MNRRRRAWWAAALAPACLAACLAIGPGGLDWPDRATEIGRAIWRLRLERVWAGFVVGAALSTAGVLMQALLRNPLADPYVLGVSGGAALGAAAAIVLGLAGALALPAAAFAGGALTLLLVYAIAAPRGRAPSVYTLLLSGVIVSAMCGALLMMLISMAPSAGLRGITWWMLGSLQVASASLLRAATVLAALGFAAAFALAPEWNALALGEEVAHHAGVRARAAALCGLGIATLTASTAVALAGLIGFVGLVVPHGMRALVGADHRRLLPAAALAGGLLLALCDALARSLRAPAELPVGIVTALLGGPFFLHLLRRRRGWET